MGQISVVLLTILLGACLAGALLELQKRRYQKEDAAFERTYINHLEMTTIHEKPLTIVRARLFGNFISQQVVRHYKLESAYPRASLLVLVFLSIAFGSFMAFVTPYHGWIANLVFVVVGIMALEILHIVILGIVIRFMLSARTKASQIDEGSKEEQKKNCKGSETFFKGS